MQKHIYEGKTFEDVKTKALSELKVAEENLIINIIEEKNTILKKSIKIEVINYNDIIDYIKEVINENLHLVEDYKNGKRVFDFFIGQTMKKTRGRANPVITSRILKEELDKA